MNALDLFSLKDRVAIVTGGARGLGRQHALALAEAGAAIAFCDLLKEEGERTRAELSLLGREALFSRVDVTVSGEIDSFIAEVIARYGRIDVLVNNAAMPSEGCPLEEVGDDLWRKIIDTNLSSMFYVGKRVAARMREAGRGSIINIASINSFVISNITPRHNVTYCVAKAGVAHLTRGMAAEWAGAGVRVNALAPGYIMTDQTAASARIPEVYERNLRNTPMGRYGRLDELKGAIIFLASDASSFMTGGVLTIDGGYTVW
ncbi:MAG: SDR family oxidoreductase [Spirochaetia bacterium]|jgi:NAD(P)-dependent dehydrogenase (short-subunit alcohol dehydrogenase family)